MCPSIWTGTTQNAECTEDRMQQETHVLILALFLLSLVLLQLKQLCVCHNDIKLFSITFSFWTTPGPGSQTVSVRTSISSYQLCKCETEPINLQTLKKSTFHSDVWTSPSLQSLPVTFSDFSFVITWRAKVCICCSWTLCVSALCSSTPPPWGPPTCPWPKSREDSLGMTSKPRPLTPLADGHNNWECAPSDLSFCSQPRIVLMLKRRAARTNVCISSERKKTHFRPNWVIFCRFIADWQCWQCLVLFFFYDTAAECHTHPIIRMEIEKYFFPPLF